MVLQTDRASGEEQFLKLSHYVDRDGDCHVCSKKITLNASSKINASMRDKANIGKDKFNSYRLVLKKKKKGNTAHIPLFVMICIIPVSSIHS